MAVGIADSISRPPALRAAGFWSIRGKEKQIPPAGELEGGAGKALQRPPPTEFLAPRACRWAGRDDLSSLQLCTGSEGTLAAAGFASGDALHYQLLPLPGSSERNSPPRRSHPLQGICDSAGTRGAGRA